jgi:drug/metabolite transporter (DMT)-like permease
VTTILIVQSALIPLLLLPIFGATFRLPAAEDLLPIAGLGLLAALGLSAFSYAISKLPAAQVAVADYSGLLWAALIGWFVFAEMPRPALALGAVLILAGSATMLLARKKPDTADPQPK